MYEEKHHQGTIYHIIVKDNLDAKWADWFDGFAMETFNGNYTLLRGSVADQAALYGLLGKINNLGLPLILVAQVDRSKFGRRCLLCGQYLDSTED